MSTSQIEPSTTYRAVLGRVFAHHRERVGLDQAAFARALGLSQSSWSRLETGSSSMSVDQLWLGASKLQMSPAALLRETEAAVEHLRHRGVAVVLSPGEVNSGAAAFLGGAALAALIAAIFRS